MKTFFISSTFKDMQAERDILHEQIIPRLRALIRRLGDDVQEVDLRWGVDTVNMSEEESGHEVLRICIDAIDRCKPYMIALLGQRYGWIPGKAIVDSAGDRRISDRYEEEMSITELEIQYGALLDSDAFDNCVFCFRDPGVLERIDESCRASYVAESPLHAHRLAALKNQIRARENAVILEYSADWDPEKQTLCGLEDFTRQLYQRLETMIRQDFEEQQARNLMEHRVSEVARLREGYLSSYVRRYPEELQIARSVGSFLRELRLNNGKRQTDCLLVTGDAGSGKTALMAYMAGSIPEVEKKTVLCLAAASGCKDAPSLKRYIAYRLETILSQPHNEDPASIDQQLRILDQKADGLGIICYVDGLDQIYQDVPDPYLDLPALCPHLFWIFSALPDFPFARAAADYHYHTVPVSGLLGVQRRDLVERTARKRGKKLDGQLVGMITDCPGAGNPLFLSLALQRLFMMNKAEFEAAEALAPGMEGLHRYMRGLLAEMPDMPEQMAAYILDATARLFDQQQFSEILMLITCAHNGLTEKELEDLLALEGLRFAPVKFQQIVSYLYDAFDQRSNGKWTFHHRLFAEAVQQLMTDADHGRIRELLARYALSDEEFLRREGYRYLLEQKHDAFAAVLENATGWQTLADISALVGKTAAEDASVRDHLVRLASERPTEAMAGFWLKFDEFLYGNEVENMAAQIIRLLLDASRDPGTKWKLALRRTYDVPTGEQLPLLASAEESAASLPEPEHSVSMSAIYAERSRALGLVRAPYDEVCPSLDSCFAWIDRALALLDPRSPWTHYRRLLQSLATAVYNAAAWDDPKLDQRVLHALEIAESLSPSTAEQEDDAVYYRVRFLSDLCETYSKKPWRNYETAKQYGDRALELAEIAAAQRPTVRNLKNRSNAISSYNRILKEAHSVPYRRQLIDCARQIYAAQKNDFNKRQVAVMEFEYAIAWFKAVKAGVERNHYETRKEAIGFMDHSTVLFEELWVTDFSRSNLAVYAALLAERAELQCDPPEETLKHGHRALELIVPRQTQAQKHYDEAADDSIRKIDARQLNWCIGWSARAYTAMANATMELLDHEGCLRYAREGMVLALQRAKTASAYYNEALTCILLIAQSSYCLRRDEEALAACDEATALLDSIGSAGESREPFDAELLYIRSRLALERGETDAAWQYCRECLSRNKTRLLINKTQILKADCLQALGDPKADEAWGDALRIWREEWKHNERTFLSGCRNILSLNKEIGQIRIPWRTSGVFTLPAFYMAYCYHHYVTTQKRWREHYDTLEQKVLAAVYHQGRGILKGKLPFDMTEAYLEGCGNAAVPDCPDFQSFVYALEAMTDFPGSRVDPGICDVILRHIEKFPDAVPDTDQYNTLNSIAKILYDYLYKENHDLYSEKQECDLLQALFRADPPFPTCRIGWIGQLEIWPREYAARSGDRWHALLKLLLLVMRRDSVVNKNNFSRLTLAYRIVSGRVGGSEEIEKANLGHLSNRDLTLLLQIYGLERELRIIFSNAYWYALKNVWTAELYRRTGDPNLIARRLREFEEFLTEPYAELYRRLDARGKTDMPTEILDAAQHLVRSLKERDAADSAMPVVRWAESVAELAGRMDLRTLELVCATNEADRIWLEERKLDGCKKVWEAGKGDLVAMRLA